MLVIGELTGCQLAKLPLGHARPMLPWCHSSPSGNGLLAVLEMLYGSVRDNNASGTSVPPCYAS